MKIKTRIALLLTFIILIIAIFNFFDAGDMYTVKETVPGLENLITTFNSFMNRIGFRTDPQERAAYGALNRYELDEKANETDVRGIRSNIFEFANELVRIEGEIIWKDEEAPMNEYLLSTEEGYIVIRYEDYMLLHDIVTIDVSEGNIETQEEYIVWGVFRGTTNHNSVYHSGNLYFVEARHIEQVIDE